MHSIIIADGLTNDLCSVEEKYQNIKLNIGYNEITRLFGEGSKYGRGVLPTFLNSCHKLNRDAEKIDIVFVRNKHKSDDPEVSEKLNRLGIHDIEGSSGIEFVESVKDLVESSYLIETNEFAVPPEQLSEIIQNILNVKNIDEVDKENVKILLCGAHTEKRIFLTAFTLRNILGFKNVAVSPHLVGSFNRDAHLNSFKYYFPDSLIEVLPNIDDIATWLNVKDISMEQFDLHGCIIDPLELTDQMNADQRRVIEDLCMHWTKAELKTLKGGFSGSLLFLAKGWKGNSSAEPMVIKVDSHLPIRKELQGYEKVKDLLGNHVPSFAPPISSGEFSGISMELATMEGAPDTLQDLFETAITDNEIDQFVLLLRRTLLLLVDRLYSNTLNTKNFIPYRQFLLHIAQQRVYLEGNIESILKQDIGDKSIDTDLIKNMFDIIRKNDDGISSEVCIAHGDLNLANVICDIRKNIWVIDWTYTTQHPIEMDFAKLENDIKLVISKNFQNEDFPNIKKFEEYLLSNSKLVDISELPKNLNFIQWDLRFKKIYLTVKEIRDAYFSLSKSDDWLVYSIALLKYSIHTLSFDNSRGMGECEAIQLWYALASVELLVYKLIADDFHLTIRGAKPAIYPARQRISIDEANWKFPCADYNPPYYVDPKVLENNKYLKEGGWAHSEDEIEFEDSEEGVKEIATDGKGYPLNPRGRTGLAGRGLLGRWGPNPYVVLVVTRFNEETNSIEILLNDSEDEIKLTENFVDFGETYVVTALGYMKKMFGFDIKLSSIPQLYTDYLYDNMQTDNAWIVARSYLIFLDEKFYDLEFDSKAYPNMKWVSLTPDIINQFSKNRAAILRTAVESLRSDELVTDGIALDILKSTG